MQADYKSSEKLSDIISAMKNALFLPQDAKASLEEIVNSPGRHKAIYFHQPAQEQGLLNALIQIAYEKGLPHCILPLSDSTAVNRLLKDINLKGQQLERVDGPLTLCLKNGGFLILRREDVSNNVLEGLNNLWSTRPGEKFYEVPLDSKLQVILINDIRAPQLSPAASGRFQHLLLQPTTLFSSLELKTLVSPSKSAYIIDLAFQDSQAVEAQLNGTIKREEKTYVWTWQEGQLISLLVKHESQPLIVLFRHADYAQNYIQNLLIKQKARVKLEANGLSCDLSLLQLALTPPQALEKLFPQIAQKNLLKVSHQQARQSQKHLYMIHYENQYQQLFSLAGTKIVGKCHEWVLSPGYLDYLNREDPNSVILIAAPLTPAQWYCLLSESRITNLWVSEEIAIPENFQGLFQPYRQDSKQALLRPKSLPKARFSADTQFVVAKDLNYAIDWFTERRPGALKIFITPEHTAQELLNQYDEKKNHSPGVLWQALQQEDREVILIGLERHPELAAELQFLWNNTPLININGRLETWTKGRLTILLDSSDLFPGFTCYNKRISYLNFHHKQLINRLNYSLSTRYDFHKEPLDFNFYKFLSETLLYIHQQKPYASVCKKLKISLTYSLLKRLIFLYEFASIKKGLSLAQAIGYSLHYGLIIRLKNEINLIDYQQLLQKIAKIFEPEEIQWPPVYNEWLDRSMAVTFSLEAYSLVFLAGPTATGKSQMAVQLNNEEHNRVFGPLTLGPQTSFQDMARLIDEWATAKPSIKDSRLILFLDEVTLASKQFLEWLNGVLDRSLILPNGKRYTLTEQHVVLMGGNLNYEGRTLHPFIQNNALIIPFPEFSTNFLQQQVVAPILYKFLAPPMNLALADLNLIQETLFELYEKIPLLESERRLDARTLTAILAHFEAYKVMDSKIANTSWQKLFHLACHQVALNGLLPAHQEALSWHLTQKLGYLRYPEPVCLTYRRLKKFSSDSKQKSDSLWLEPKNTRKLAAFYLCDLLVSQYWREHHQKNPPSVGGALVIGPTSTGKDCILKAVMAVMNYKPGVNYQSINAGPFIDIKGIKEKVIAQGLKLHIEELDLWPSGLIEGVFNDVLTGQAPAGFRFYATANGKNYQGRGSLSSPLLSRLELYSHQDYSLKELEVLIGQQTSLKIEVVTQLMRVHIYFLGDGMASSRHALQAARLISEGVPFIQACARAYADSLRLPKMKAIESQENPHRLAVIHAYLQIHYSILQPLLRTANFSPACVYNAELKTVTISKGFFKGIWNQCPEHLLKYILQLHLAFPLAEEQVWLEPLLTIIQQVRLLTLCERYYENKTITIKSAFELFYKIVKLEKESLFGPVLAVVLQIFKAPLHPDFADLLTCIPDKLVTEDYKNTQQEAVELWNGFYEQMIKPMGYFPKEKKGEVENKIEQKYQAISLDSSSGFSQLNKKQKILGKVHRFDGADSGPLYFETGILSYRSHPVKFEKNKILDQPKVSMRKMEIFEFKDKRPEFRITLEYSQATACGRHQDQQGFRLLAPEGFWPLVNHEQKSLLGQDDKGFYIQIFASNGQVVTRLDKICYDLYKIPTQSEEKKISDSSDSRKNNYQTYFQIAPPDLQNLMKEILKNKHSENSKKLFLLNCLLKYFTEKFSYLDSEIDQKIISNLDLIYNEQPTAQEITEWVLKQRKGVCFEFAIAFYTLCHEIFSEWYFELHIGYTESKNIIEGVAHTWVVLKLPGQNSIILDPTPGMITNVSSFSEMASASKWIKPISNKFFLSNAQALATIKEKIVPLLQCNELRSTQVTYQDKPGLLDYHLAARGVAQCFRINQGLKNHQYSLPILIIEYLRCPTSESLDSWVIDIYFWEELLRKKAGIYIWTAKGAHRIYNGFDLIKNLPRLQKPEENLLQEWQKKQAQKAIIFDRKKYQFIFSKLLEVCKYLEAAPESQFLQLADEEKEVKESKIIMEEAGAASSLISESQDLAALFSKECILIRDANLREKDLSADYMDLEIKASQVYIFQGVKLACLPSIENNQLNLYLYSQSSISQKLIDYISMFPQIKILNFESILSSQSYLICEKLKIPAQFTKIKFVSCEFNQTVFSNIFTDCHCPKIVFDSCWYDKNIYFPSNCFIKKISFEKYADPLQLDRLSQFNALTFSSLEDGSDLVTVIENLKNIKKPIYLTLRGFSDNFRIDLTSIRLKDIDFDSSDLYFAIDGFNFCKFIQKFIELGFSQLVVIWEDRLSYELVSSITDMDFLKSSKNVEHLNKLLFFEKDMNAEKFVNSLLFYKQIKLKLIHRYEPLDIQQFVSEVSESLQLESPAPKLKM